MKNLLIALFILLSLYELRAQEPFTIIEQVNLDSLVKTVRILSGEDSVMIGGEKTIIKERHTQKGTDLAAEYIKGIFTDVGLEVTDQKYSATGRNIYATQPGSSVPDSFYIICAHYDSVTDFCADDNASGSAAVLEAARLLNDSCFKYSILYALWDEEELGLVGSFYFASQLQNLNLKIKGVLNMDMISFDSNSDNIFDIHIDNSLKSGVLKDELLKVIIANDLKLSPSVKNPGTNGSDHTPFWMKGIGAVLIIEGYYSGDFNKFYHTANDRIDKFNMPYFHEMAKLGIVTLKSLAFPCNSPSQVSGDPEELILIYPNPTRSTVRIFRNSNDCSEVWICDIYGKIIYKTPMYDEIDIDLSNYDSGMYIVSILGENTKLTRKILKLD
jgi:hypothetical protein